MIKVFLVIHLLIALVMVGVVLLQRSEGGALGIGGGGSGFMTGRQAGNLLTRITAFLAAAFMVTSLALAVLGEGNTHAPGRSILDQVGREDSNSVAFPSPMSPAASVSPDVTIVPAPPPAAAAPTVEGTTPAP